MKLKISVTLLNDALSLLEPLAAKDSPIMRAVLIDTYGDEAVSLSCSGNTMQATRRISAKIDNAGTVLVDARSLRAIMGKLPKDQDVTLQISDEQLAISCRRSRFKLPLLDTKAFPSLESDKTTAPVVAGAAQLAGIIAPVIHAMISDDSRANLNGISLAVNAEHPGLHVAATDGHRLAVRSLQELTPELPEGGLLVPREAAREILRFLDKAREVEIRFDTRRLQISDGANILITRLIDQRFPDYERLIPSNASTILTLVREDLLSALDRVLTVEGQSKRVEFAISKGAVEMTVSNDNQLGSEALDLEYELTDEDVKRADFVSKFAVNGRFLSEAVKSFSSNLIELRLRGDRAPILVAPAVLEDTPDSQNRSLEIVMPIML